MRLMEKVRYNQKIKKLVTAAHYAAAYFGEGEGDNKEVTSKNLRIIRKKVGALYTITVTKLTTNEEVLEASYKSANFGNVYVPDYKIKLGPVDKFSPGYWEKRMSKIMDEVLLYKKREEKFLHNNFYS